MQIAAAADGGHGGGRATSGRKMSWCAASAPIRPSTSLFTRGTDRIRRARALVAGGTPAGRARRRADPGPRRRAGCLSALSRAPQPSVPGHVEPTPMSL